LTKKKKKKKKKRKKKKKKKSPLKQISLFFVVSSAMTECMSISTLLDPSILASQAQKYAANDEIDALGNVTRQKFYLYSGQSDYTVATDVVKAIETVMRKLGTPRDQLCSRVLAQRRPRRADAELRCAVCRLEDALHQRLRL
jgi:hypothetical protein